MKTATSAPVTTQTIRHNILKELTADEAQKYCRIPQTIGFVYHASFASPSTEDKLFGENADPIEVPAWTHFPEVPEDIVTVHAKRMTLSAADEVKLFLRY